MTDRVAVSVVVLSAFSRMGVVTLYGGRKQMRVPIECPEIGCGAFCGEVGWSSRFSSFNCPDCGASFEANGMGDILMEGDS